MRCKLVSLGNTGSKYLDDLSPKSIPLPTVSGVPRLSKQGVVDLHQRCELRGADDGLPSVVRHAIPHFATDASFHLSLERGTKPYQAGAQISDGFGLRSVRPRILDKKLYLLRLDRLLGIGGVGNNDLGDV